MVTITIETVGDEKFIRGMNRYVEQMKDFREVFKQIHSNFQEIVTENFDTGGTPLPFRPAQNERYIEWKRKKVGHNRPMILFETLRDSLTGRNQHTNVKIRKTSALFGTTVPYAEYHYYARQSKAVQLTEQQKRDWARMIQVWSYKKFQEMAIAPSLRSTV